jgi:hypothetical protein
MSNSNARRFVQSAWTLLSFQLIASVGAVGVTGLAAFHVQRIAAQLEATQPATAIETTEAREAEPEAHADAEAARDQETASGDAAPTETATADATPVIAPCQRQGNVIRVQANTEWCDTGIQVQRGQHLIFSAQGRWSTGGEAIFGPAGAERRTPETLTSEALHGALIGRAGEQTFAIGAGGNLPILSNGPLYLSTNDVSGRFADNEGFVDVFLQSPRQ